MLRWIAGLLGLSDPHAERKRGARMTEQDALAVARAAGEGVSDLVSLHFAAITEEGGERFWIFATSSRGSAWTVKIRDRDGQVIERGRAGVR